MKKTILLFIIALFVVSCEGPMGPQGLDGPQGYGTNWKIVNLEVKSSNWIESIDKDGLNRYYSCNFAMPEIDAMIYDEGTVIAYIDNGTSQQTLPSVRHFENINNKWTQTIDYEFSEGNIDLFVTNSNFASILPGDMKIRVVLMW